MPKVDWKEAQARAFANPRQDPKLPEVWLEVGDARVALAVNY